METTNKMNLQDEIKCLIKTAELAVIGKVFVSYMKANNTEDRVSKERIEGLIQDFYNNMCNYYKSRECPDGVNAGAYIEALDTFTQVVKKDILESKDSVHVYTLHLIIDEDIRRLCRQYAASIYTVRVDAMGYQSRSN